jgi:plasmid maintenance system killer protein
LLPLELAHPFQSGYGIVPAKQSSSPSVTNGVADPPPQRVSRWSSLFTEELVEMHRMAASQQPMSDTEPQQILYLAGRLLSTVTYWPNDRIETLKVWHRKSVRKFSAEVQRMAWRRLAYVNAAEQIGDPVGAPGNQLEKLKGKSGRVAHRVETVSQPPQRSRRACRAATTAQPTVRKRTTTEAQKK